MRLLYIANLRLPTEKAYGIQIAKMCEAFASQNFDVTLVFPFRQNLIKEDFFSYYSVNKKFKIKRIWAFDFYFFGQLDKIAVSIKEIISALLLSFYAITQKADVIYSRDEWPLYFLSFFKNNLVFEAHRFSKSRTLFYKRFKSKSFKIVAITQHLKDDFIKIGFRPENILVAPDGVDLAEFNIDISKDEARTRVGLPLSGKIVMYTGHLFEWKGAQTLLQVARMTNAKGQMSNVLFVFVGGTDYDIAKFREKAKGLDNVLILGHKPHKEIPFFLKSADILILPNSAKEEISRSYTSPLKLFEYMTSKGPIVASDLPSIREVLNETNSFLVEPDNPNALARGVNKILDDPELAKNISNKASQNVQERTWLKRAETILNFSR